MLVGQFTIFNSRSGLSSLTSSVELGVSLLVVDENIGPSVPLDKVRNEIQSLLQVLVVSVVNFLFNIISFVNGIFKLLLGDFTIRTSLASRCFELLSSHSLLNSLLGFFLGSLKFKFHHLVLSLKECNLVLILVELR